MLNVTPEQAGQSDSFRQFEGGVKLGIGSFNLVGLIPSPKQMDGWLMDDGWMIGVYHQHISKYEIRKSTFLPKY